MKKIFYISIGLLLLLLIFLAAYNFAFRNNVNDPIADPEKQVSDEEFSPPSAPTTIQNPINEEVMGTTISNNGDLYYYSFDDQSLKKASLEGKDKSVLLSNLPGKPSRIVWSPKQDKVLLFLRQSDGRSLWYFADITTKTLVPLREEMSRMAWSNLGDKILYQYTDPKSGERSLNVANPDGSAWKKLAFLYRDSFIAPIPQSTSISFWGQPNALEKTYFESVSPAGENRTILFSEKFGADYLWSPNGENALVSTSDEKGGKNILLSVINKNGGELRSLAIPTFVSKTVWSADNKTVYYALPGALPENALLPNDYFEKSLHTKDTFWKIDTTTGKKTRIADLKEVTQNFDSAELLLSPKEDMFFFTDRTTRRLYRIDL